MTETPRRWWHELNGYHWFVLVVCTLGWLFDCLDQQLFNLARKPAVTELLQAVPGDVLIDKYGGFATSVMLIGWATGGILFGIMGDRVGRARTMVWTILAYSIFTGLSGFSQTIWDFTFFRFMTGLGVGGQFAVGVSLVAEVMPDRARPYALGMLQALSAIGNVAAAMVAISFGMLEASGAISHSAWRWMFAVGILPALLAVLVIRRLKEPEKWQQSVGQDRQHKRKAGSLRELFGVPRWRKRVIMGMFLASAGVIGLWGIGFFSIDLNRSIFRKSAEQRFREEGQAEQDRQLLTQALHGPEAFGQIKKKLSPPDWLSLESSNRDPSELYAAALTLEAEGQPVSPEAVLAALDTQKEDRPAQSVEQRQRRAAYLDVTPPAEIDLTAEIARIDRRQKEIKSEVSYWGGITSLMFNIGAFFGIYAFSRVTQRLGRRPTFAIFFLAAFVTTIVAFLYMNRATDVYWMVPLMGFFQLSVFGGYAIYFPELFPTHLRSTGVSFCYNIGRFAAALGPSALGLLTSEVFTPEKGYLEPMRHAGVTMCSIFLLGVVVLAFAPETKDQPLPE